MTTTDLQQDTLLGIRAVHEDRQYDIGLLGEYFTSLRDAWDACNTLADLRGLSADVIELTKAARQLADDSGPVEERRVNLPDMVNIVGPRDEFLHILEHQIQVSIQHRGNEVDLTGSPGAIDFAIEVITELVTEWRSGQHLTADWVLGFVRLQRAISPQAPPEPAPPAAPRRRRTKLAEPPPMSSDPPSAQIAIASQITAMMMKIVILHPQPCCGLIATNVARCCSIKARCRNRHRHHRAPRS